MFRSSKGLKGGQLERALRSDPITRKQFRGVWAVDLLPPSHRPGIYICNTATSQDPGEHWIAFYFPSHGPVEFFDSMGHVPEYYQVAFQYFMIQEGRDYLYNCKQIQNYGTSTCGYYCLYFAAQRCRGQSMIDIVKSFDSENLTLNELKVVDFVDSHYSM